MLASSAVVARFTRSSTPVHEAAWLIPVPISSAATDPAKILVTVIAGPP